MSIQTKTTWVLVADGAAAQIYSIHAIPFRLTKVPAGELKATRKMAHEPQHKAANVTHVGNHHGDHQRQENVFVEHVAQTLDTAAKDGEFDDVIVVLPPKALSHFRKIAAPNLQKRIKQEIQKDWTHLGLPDLEKHLSAALP